MKKSKSPHIPNFSTRGRPILLKPQISIRPGGVIPNSENSGSFHVPTKILISAKKEVAKTGSKWPKCQ